MLQGIGCYMFRIDDMEVVDATMKGSAARFINHSCDVRVVVTHSLKSSLCIQCSSLCRFSAPPCVDSVLLLV